MSRYDNEDAVALERMKEQLVSGAATTAKDAAEQVARAKNSPRGASLQAVATRLQEKFAALYPEWEKHRSIGQ